MLRENASAELPVVALIALIDNDTESRDNIWSFDGLIPVPGPVGPSLGRPTALP